jgi:hypothetical protein
MNDPKSIMDAVDRHVKASLEKFAGAKRDTAATRKAVEDAVSGAQPPTAVDVTHVDDPAPRAASSPTGIVPDPGPPKQKRRPIFGGGG